LPNINIIARGLAERLTDNISPAPYERLKEAARKRVGEDRFNFIEMGAGKGDTVKANLESFDRWRIVPRVLRNVSKRELSTILFGIELPTPILVAPLGRLAYLRKNAEVGLAGVAKDLRVPFILSTFASTTIEQIAQVMGDSPRCLQLFPSKDGEITSSFIRRAEATGYSAVVVTVDKAANYPHYLSPGGREFEESGSAIYFSDPIFQSRLGASPEEDREKANKLWRETRFDTSFSWESLDAIRGETKLPVIVKGILHPEDAELAVQHGVSGIVVSNHGGRSMDGEVASLDALPAIAEKVGRRVPVLLDGGIRTGSDIFKALALGAAAVLIGRICAFGYAAGGVEGARTEIVRLIDELDAAMATCGCASLADAEQSMVRLT
jgi:lactate 2-monooxygenase